MGGVRCFGGDPPSQFHRHGGALPHGDRLWGVPCVPPPGLWGAPWGVLAVPTPAPRCHVLGTGMTHRPRTPPNPPPGPATAPYTPPREQGLGGARAGGDASPQVPGLDLGSGLSRVPTGRSQSWPRGGLPGLGGPDPVAFLRRTHLFIFCRGAGGREQEDGYFPVFPPYPCRKINPSTPRVGLISSRHIAQCWGRAAGLRYRRASTIPWDAAAVGKLRQGCVSWVQGGE